MTRVGVMVTRLLVGRGVEGSGKGAEVMALNVGGVGGLFTFIIYLHDRLARLVSLVSSR